MAPSRRHSNGRSPLVNPQRQITSFFSKSASSSPITSTQNSTNPSPKPKPKPSRSPSSSTPSPLQSKLKKPLLVIGGDSPPSLWPLTPATEKLHGDEVVENRIKVYWPLDKSWYEGSVKSFDRDSHKHLVQYDDGEEELLDLAKEKIEWIEQSVRKFKRLRRGGSSLSVENMVIDHEVENLEDEEEDNGDDSSDEDWGKTGEKEGLEDSEENEVVELDDEDEENEAARSKGKRGGKGWSRKRKVAGEEEKVGSDKKTKGGEDVSRGGFKVSLVEPTNNNAESGKASNAINTALSGDASERFSICEATKLRFLGEGRRDSKRRRPGDPDYDPRTLYLPPDFVRSLSDGQRQWWEFKSKHMDKVLFFKMGKFYELFEMDAHTGAKELDLQYMKGEQPHCGFPERNFSINLEKLARKGYRVLVVEQTETPEQLELRRKEKGSQRYGCEA